MTPVVVIQRRHPPGRVAAENPEPEQSLTPAEQAHVADLEAVRRLRMENEFPKAVAFRPNATVACR